MKKILSILGVITLVGTSTTSLVACNTPQEYTPEELAKLKEENKIKTNNQEIKDNLEGITPQEKPFKEVNNKYFYVVWFNDESNKGKLTKFKYDENLILQAPRIKLDNSGNFVLYLTFDINNGYMLSIRNNKVIHGGGSKKYDYFKSVYRGNLDTQEPDLILDENGNVKVSGE